MMDSIDNRKIYVKPAVGFDEVDLPAWSSWAYQFATRRTTAREGCRSRHGALAHPLKKHCISRRIAQARPRRQLATALNPYGQRLSTQTVGIVGLGRIGTAALRLKASIWMCNSLTHSNPMDTN